MLVVPRVRATPERCVDAEHWREKIPKWAVGEQLGTPEESIVILGEQKIRTVIRDLPEDDRAVIEMKSVHRVGRDARTRVVDSDDLAWIAIGTPCGMKCRPIVVEVHADSVARPRSADGAYPDGSDESVAGVVSLFLALASPESVLVILTGVLTAVDGDPTGTAYVPRFGFSPLAGLRPLGRGWEEEVGHSTTGGSAHPTIVGSTTGDDDLYGELTLV